MTTENAGAASVNRADDDLRARIEALCDEAERGDAIVISPGYLTFFCVEVGRIRAVLAIPDTEEDRP